MGADVPKQYLPLCGRPVIVHTIERLRTALPDAQMLVAVSAWDVERMDSLTDKYRLGPLTICEGGQTRFHTVQKALGVLGECDYVMVHDAVRPLVSRRVIDDALAAARAHGAAVPVAEPVDSFRVVLADGGSQPFDRSVLRAVQTPQAFRAGILREAYQTEYDPRFTDDASVVEHSGTRVALSEGSRTNIKITTPEDMTIAEAIMKTEDNG